jgi:outer membrane protein OmpA-like peptidoglycan-associated protein/tetratricopeptide (TPR) repeat protein
MRHKGKINFYYKIMKFFFYLIFSFIFTGILSAKNDPTEFKKIFEKANNHFLNQEYNKALPLFLKLDSIQPNNNNINFKIGLCYFNSPSDRTKSVPYFEKAVKNISEKYNKRKSTETAAPLIAIYYLAKSYHLNYNFDDAIDYFIQFRKYVPDSNLDQIDDINRNIQMSNNAKMYVSAPIQITIDNLGGVINTKYGEYAPVISADESTLIFTSRRPESTGGKQTENGKYFEDIYISNKINGEWTTPVKISVNINTPKHEASVGLSVDGQRLLLYKDDGMGGNLYTSSLIGDEWSIPQRLSDNVNSKSCEPSASISADGTILYFTSDRKGGYGGRDIYQSVRLPNGDWSLPANLGPSINTPYDEDGPFIHPDGKTLFFSSKGHNSMGGFDVFFTVKNTDGSWEKPFNIGYPVNTTDDDIYYVLSADGKRAYYSSSQEGGYGEKDIYMITFIEQKETPLALVKGNIFTKDMKVPNNLEIVVTDNETGEIVGIYTPNSKTGTYLFILPPGGNYNVSYEAVGYLFKSENIFVPEDANYFEVNKSIDMSPIDVGEILVLKNIFFDLGKSSLSPTSNVELDKLYQLMIKNPNMKIEISGHTDHKGKDEINNRISKERAQAVVDYLINKNIKKDRLTAQGYGSKKPVLPNTYPNGTDNEDAMKTNRRVELTIVSMEE